MWLVYILCLKNINKELTANIFTYFYQRLFGRLNLANSGIKTLCTVYNSLKLEEKVLIMA